MSLRGIVEFIVVLASVFLFFVGALKVAAIGEQNRCHRISQQSTAYSAYDCATTLGR